MIRRLLTISALLAMLPSTQSAQAEEQQNRSLAQSPVLTLPMAPMPSPETLVEPPHECSTWPIRPDGQPEMMWNDVTVNLTEPISRYYYNPKWRGEVWAPFQLYWLSERATRLMSTWPEYDEFSVLRKFNRVNKFFEHYSGYE